MMVLGQLLWDPWQAAKKTMPRWRFSMLYDGLFSRPADLIYGSFDETRHKIPRIAIPPDWPRFLGLDFGGVNTAGIFFAQERDAYPRNNGAARSIPAQYWVSPTRAAPSSRLAQVALARFWAAQRAD